MSSAGIELLTIDARIVIASVDTYLRFAEAVEPARHRPGQRPRKDCPNSLDSVPENVAKSKVKGLAEGVKEAIKGD